MTITTDDTMRIRRAVVRLTQKMHGESVKVQWNGGPEDAMAQAAVSYGRTRRIGVRVDRFDQGMTLTRDDGLLESRYSALDRLDLGESHVFNVNRSEEQAVRMAAWQRGRSGQKRFTCTVVPEGVKVSRVALDAPVKRGRAARPARWDLSPLETRVWIEFQIGLEDIAAVRQAVTAAQHERGWTLTTRIVAGTMRVIRLDHPATGPAPAPVSDAAVTAWATRHDLKGNLSEWHAIVDDARSLHLIEQHADADQLGQSETTSDSN